MDNMIGVGTDKPRDTSLTHCSPTVLLGLDASPAPVENSRAGPASTLARCRYCQKPDAAWKATDLGLGKRAIFYGPGVEYHCMTAFYGAQ